MILSNSLRTTGYLDPFLLSGVTRQHEVGEPGVVVQDGSYGYDLCIRLQCNRGRDRAARKRRTHHAAAAEGGILSAIGS